VERYLGLHAPDFVWIQAEERIVEGLQEYGARIRRSFEELPAGITVHLEFRFNERIAGAGWASERGVARMSGDGPRGPLPVRYSVFHTVARRATADAGGSWWTTTAVPPARPSSTPRTRWTTCGPSDGA